jgi:cytochrome b subunit of formate dehydrogenase
MSMDRIVRHRGSDRLFHWVMAASVLLLLGTGLLPAIGIRFDWVALHWISGLVLVAAILFHIVRISTGGNLRAMLLSKRDLEQVRATLGAPPVRPGKYSVAQKAMHYVAALLSLAAVATGLLMMVKVDTPFWARNPYWLDAGTWGGIYVVHGFAALCLVSVVMLHVYFALRPEKRRYLRAMLRGWMSRADYRAHHDETLWTPESIPDTEKGPH